VGSCPDAPSLNPDQAGSTRPAFRRNGAFQLNPHNASNATQDNGRHRIAEAPLPPGRKRKKIGRSCERGYTVNVNTAISKRRTGFTLLEIALVVGIIGLLAALAIPSFAKIRATSRKQTCANNLRLIRDAELTWALANNKTATDTPAVTDIAPYIEKGVVPACPEGNVAYTIGDVATGPTCSIH
jgi:prepilin-type N-terminal cleavage/methylation domain-containing protein